MTDATPTSTSPHPGSGCPKANGRRTSGWRRSIWTTSGAGNLGVLPIVIGLILIVVFFTLQGARTSSPPNNFNNIIVQMAGTCMLAYGVVFVLLLGEIDLSIGYLSGLAAVAVAELQLPGRHPTTTFHSRSSRR